MKVIINVHGGCVQDVYVDDPKAQVILVDWDSNGASAGEHDSLFAIGAANGAVAHVAMYPTTPIEAMPADMQEAMAQASS